MLNKHTSENITNRAKEQWADLAQMANTEWKELKDKAHDANPFREKSTWEKIKDQFTPAEKNAWEKLTHSSMIDFDEEDYTIAGVILGTLTAFGLGYVLHSLVSKKRTIHPDDVLKEVKKKFKEEGPIEGSWIEMTTAPWKRYSYHTDVYYGGITRLEEDEYVQYEFIADAHTGTLMNLYRI